MVNGRLNGFVTNQDADGKRFEGTYVNGDKSSDWSEVIEISGANDATAVSQAQRTELVAAVLAGNFYYDLNGMGNSGAMQMRVVNKTEREWLVQIEVGTKLEPSSGNVQSMVVTKEIELHMHPHDSQTVELEVACLDISKPPPATNDTHWRASVSASLAEFIACVNRMLATESANSSTDEQAMLRSAQPLFLQVALWQARGATKDQWIDFFVHYQRMSQQQAQGMADMAEQLGGAIVQGCPSM